MKDSSLLLFAWHSDIACSWNLRSTIRLPFCSVRRHCLHTGVTAAVCAALHNRFIMGMACMPLPCTSHVAHDRFVYQFLAYSTIQQKNLIIRPDWGVLSNSTFFLAGLDDREKKKRICFLASINETFREAKYFTGLPFCLAGFGNTCPEQIW